MQLPESREIYIKKYDLVWATGNGLDWSMYIWWDKGDFRTLKNLEEQSREIWNFHELWRAILMRAQKENKWSVEKPWCS